MLQVTTRGYRSRVRVRVRVRVKARVNINYQISLKDKINNKTNISEPPEEKLDNYLKTTSFDQEFSLADVVILQTKPWTGFLNMDL